MTGPTYRRFKLPLPSPRMTAMARPSVSMQPLLLFIEVEVAERDVSRGITLLRGRVPMGNLMVETPWTYLADDIAARPDRLRDALTHQAWEECDSWINTWVDEERWS